MTRKLLLPSGSSVSSSSARPARMTLFPASSRHVHTRIDGAELPGSGKGPGATASPYTLVPTRTEELFRHEDGARRRWLTWVAAEPVRRGVGLALAVPEQDRGARFAVRHDSW